MEKSKINLSALLSLLIIVGLLMTYIPTYIEFKPTLKFIYVVVSYIFCGVGGYYLGQLMRNK